MARGSGLLFAAALVASSVGTSPRAARASEPVPGDFAELAAAQPVPAAPPQDRIPLASIGYQDATLHGRSVSAEYFLPGPGNFALAEDPWLDLDILPSELLTRESVITVVWNGLPLQDRRIGDAPGRMRLTLSVPRDRVDPAVNRLQVLGTLMVGPGVCGNEENVAQHLTVFNTTQVRYSLAGRQAGPGPEALDLASYPAPFETAATLPIPPVRVVVPAHPTGAELTALVRVAAYLGQQAGNRPLPLAVLREGEFGATDLAGAGVIFIGRQSALPTLSQLPSDAAGVPRSPDGSYLTLSGQALAPDTGVVFEQPSPWDAERIVLVATGAGDVAVERAASVLSGRAGVRTLRGSFALVDGAQMVPAGERSGGTRSASAERITAVPVLLADLGRSDEEVSGIGDHTLSFSVEAPAAAKRLGMPLEVVISHSSLLDGARSSLRVLLNGVPLASSAFRDLPAEHGRLRIMLPAASLRPGANAVSLELSLHLPRIDDGQICARVPAEQAWAVLHSDSNVLPPSPESASAAGDVSLANYPYPFVRTGSLDETLLVVPDDLRDLSTLARFSADLGRTTRADLLAPRTILASALTPELLAAHDVVVWGVPEENPVLGQLGNRLPIRVGLDGQRLVLGPDLTVAVRDHAELGVAQVIASPWGPERSVLALSGTSQEGVALVVEALRQGGLRGNAALVSRREAPVLAPPRTGRLVEGTNSSAATPLQTSTFRIRPQRETAGAADSPARYLPLGAVALGFVAAALALGLVAGAFAPRRRRGQAPKTAAPPPYRSPPVPPPSS